MPGLFIDIEVDPTTVADPDLAAKLVEVEALIRRSQAMKRVLEASLRCGCLNLEDCPTALEAGLDPDFACGETVVASP